MHGHLNLVLVGERRHLPGRAHGRAGGKNFHAHRLGHLEASVDFGIAETVVEAQVVGVQFDSGIVPLLSDVGKRVERRLEAPFAEFLASARSGGLRLHVALPEFHLTQADFLAGFDGFRHRPVPEAV